MIQRMLAIWSLVPLHFLKPAWTSGGSRFMYCWSLAWRILNITSIWNECNCAVVWAFFGLPFFGIAMRSDLFQSCCHCWVFHICWYIECLAFTASSFRIWSSSTGIPSAPLVMFIVILPKAYLTSHSSMSGSRWVITPSWLSESWRSFLYSSSVYSCHLFLSSVSVRSIPFLSFIEPIFAWNVPFGIKQFHSLILSSKILEMSSYCLSLDEGSSLEWLSHGQMAEIKRMRAVLWWCHWMFTQQPFFFLLSSQTLICSDVYFPLHTSVLEDWWFQAPAPGVESQLIEENPLQILLWEWTYNPVLAKEMQETLLRGFLDWFS